MALNKNEIDKFFKKLSEKKLVQIHKELAQEKFDGIIGTLCQVIIEEYGVDPIFATTILRNKVQEILATKYIKIKKKK